MPTYSPSTPVSRIGGGGDIPTPPTGGDGGDHSQGSNYPNYGARLRRARLGLICAIATVSMVFISLTSAYVVRQGLPTFDGATNSYVRDWGMVQLPWVLLFVNTALLLISSVTMEFARRDITQRAALSVARRNCAAGRGISGWAVAGLVRAEGARIFCEYKSEQLVCLFADGGACGAFDGRDYCADLGSGGFPTASAD
jgi:hypothetical protein